MAFLRAFPSGNGQVWEDRGQLLRIELGETLKCNLCSGISHGIRARLKHWLKSHPHIASSPPPPRLLLALTHFSWERFPDGLDLRSLARALLPGGTGLRRCLYPQGREGNVACAGLPSRAWAPGSHHEDVV